LNELVRPRLTLPGSTLRSPPFLDVTGENIVSPFDILQILGYLWRNRDGEGEASAASLLESSPGALDGDWIARNLRPVRRTLTQEPKQASVAQRPLEDSDDQNAGPVVGSPHASEVDGSRFDNWRPQGNRLNRLVLERLFADEPDWWSDASDTTLL
jgi:hypothetical protein